MMAHHALIRNVTTAFALVALLSRVGQAQAPIEATRDIPTQIELSGQVTSDANNPIAGATVTLVAAADYMRQFFANLDPRQPWLETDTDEQGHFRLGFSSDDQRFLIPGEALLLIRARRYQPRLMQLSMSRMQIDVPLKVQLDPSIPVEIEVRSSDGQLVEAATVFPASINGMRIPWAVARNFTTATTDSLGRVRINESAPDSLDGVFVITREAANQRLAVNRSPNGDLQTTMMATRSINGQITSPGHDSIPGVHDVKMFIATLPESTSPFMNPPLHCSWATAPITKSGRFQVKGIGLGELNYLLSCPANFPFREPYKDERTSLDAGREPLNWHIEFVKQVKLKAKVIDADSGSALPNIHISTWDGRLEPTFTDGAGRAEFFRIRDRVSYYPRDGLEEFFFAAAFYRGSKKVPTDGEIELEPVALNRSSSWRGNVIDQHGQPIAAAQVKYEYAEERFNMSRMTFSDSQGNFRLRGVANGTAVKLRALKDHAVSDWVSLVLPSDERLLLELVPQRSAKPTGRVLDISGKPIAGVAVTIKRGEVYQKENYNREQVTVKELYSTAPTVRTDNRGGFEFPPTIDFKQRLQIQIRDPQVFPFHSTFIDGSKMAERATGPHTDTLNLGDFRVMRRPGLRSVSLLVESAQGKPIADAEIVVVGARTGTVRGATDLAGQVRLDVPDGQAIIAIRAPRHVVYFGELPAVDALLRFALQPATTPARSDGVASIWRVGQARFAEAAEEIFEGIQPADPEASTLRHLRAYTTALACLAPEQYLQYLQLNMAKYSQLHQIALFSGAEHALTRKPGLIELAIESSLIPDNNLCAYLITAANATQDADMRDEWLGEALVAARQTPDILRRYSYMAGLAQIFLASGNVELAKQVTSELWSGASNLQEITASGKRQQMVGESRTVGPMLAIINLEQAQRFIELTGQENEIPSLQTQARLNWAQAHPQEFVSRLRDGSIGPIDDRGVASWVDANSWISRLNKKGLPGLDEFSHQIGDAQTRLRLLVYHARITRDHVLRHDLLRLAVAAIRECEPSAASDHYVSHYTRSLLPELREFRGIDPGFLNQLIFAALWNLPQQFETDRLHTVLGGAAQLVALRDRRLARTMLEPGLVDRGWLFMGRTLDFGRNEALISVARIDPDWSVELVDRLCEKELRHNLGDQYELRSGMIRVLISMVRD